MTLNLGVAVLGYLWIHDSCRPAVDVCSTNPLMDAGCSKAVSLTACVLLTLSVFDRFSTVLLYPKSPGSFLLRMGESGGVVIAWQLVGDREGLAPLFVSLLLARRARFAMPRVSKYACVLLRLAVAAVAFSALGKNCNTLSQKAAVGILLSTIVLGSSCPRDPVEAGEMPRPQRNNRGGAAAT